MNTSLYYFNPGHEGALLNASPYYTYPSNVIKMQQDLAYLPAWYANNKDYILINKPLPSDFLSTINELNPLAKGITCHDLASINPPISKIHLWGISPQAIHQFQKLNKTQNIELQLPLWNNNLIKLSSRETARDCLNYLQQNILSIDNDLAPLFLKDLESLENYVLSSPNKLLVKAPYSSSGRGLVWLPIGQLNRSEKQIIHGMLKNQGTVSIEKVLDKIIDFAMEFDLNENGKCKFIGYSYFVTNSKGNYSHNFICSQDKIIKDLNEFVSNEELEKTKYFLIKYIEEKFNNVYSGCIGIDMMLYKNKNTFKLHPCLEINVRDNMGIIAYNIFKNHIQPQSHGYFYIDYKKNKNNLIDEEDSMMKKKYPLIIHDNKIYSGYLSLCPIDRDTQYRAYIIINRD